MAINKKAFYFSIDALIAISILFIFLAVAIPLIYNDTSSSEINYDIISSFSSLKINDINNTYVKSLIDAGIINDTSKNILEQIGEFYSTDKNMARSLAEAVMSDLSTKENVGIWYGNTLLASKNSSAYETAEDIDVATQIISGIKEGENITGFAARAYLSKNLQTK